MVKRVLCMVYAIVMTMGVLGAYASEWSEESTIGAISYDGMLFNESTGSIVKGKSGDVKIPDEINGIEVTGIGNGAFAGIYGLSSIDIPKTVTTIGENAFSACNLKTITGGENVTSVGGQAFFDTPWCTEKDGHIVIGKVYIGYNGNASTVTIPEGVERFSERMEGDFIQSVKKVILPTTLKEVSYCAFRNCKALEEVVFKSKVMLIGDNAFEDCSALKSIVLPEGITEIGNNAFYRCKSLESISIPNTVKTIGDMAFYGCNAMKTIEIPASVDSVGTEALTVSAVDNVYVYGANTVFKDATTGNKLYGNKDKTVYCIQGSSAEEYANHRTFSVVYIEENISNDNKENSSSDTSFGSKVSSWAKEEIEEAYESNLVPESLVGFDLTKKVTRSEFAAIAVQLYTELSEDDEHFYGKYPFDDIDKDVNEEAILDAYYFGFTLGMGERRFEPALLITREQLATMLCRVIKKNSFDDWSIDRDNEYYMNIDGAKKFDDDADISEYAKNSVYYLALHGVIKGIDDTHFAPKNTTSQQEAAGYATATREQALLLSLRIYKLSDLWK